MGEPQRGPGPPRLLRGYLRSIGGYANTQKKRKNPLGRSSGRGQIPRGGYGGFESVFVLEWEGASCFSSVSQRDGQWPAGTPLPSPAWQLNSHGRSAELREIPADVRAAMNEQVCPLLLLPPASLPFLFPPATQSIIRFIQNRNSPLSQRS